MQKDIMVMVIVIGVELVHMFGEVHHFIKVVDLWRIMSTIQTVMIKDQVLCLLCFLCLKSDECSRLLTQLKKTQKRKHELLLIGSGQMKEKCMEEGIENMIV